METEDDKQTQSQKVLAVLKAYAYIGITAEELKEKVMVPQYNWCICEDLRKAKKHVIVSWRGRRHPSDPKPYWRFYYCGRVGEGWLYPPKLYPRDVVTIGWAMFAALSGIFYRTVYDPKDRNDTKEVAPRFTME